MFLSRIKKDLILLSGMLCLMLQAVSCDPINRHDHLHRATRINNLGGQESDRQYSVLVLHSYNDMGQEGSYFKNYMDRCFRRHGMNVHADHIYLDLSLFIRTFLVCASTPISPKGLVGSNLASMSCSEE